ncbi:MAG: DUF1674 domain-containing protein [Rhodobacteraceae bacterium]|nr:DUF1674 domain-containing protein [Paracoccaceae bacterium]
MTNKKNTKKPSKETIAKALFEAELRKKNIKEVSSTIEINGPSGIEPTRYGDWERKGIASDF